MLSLFNILSIALMSAIAICDVQIVTILKHLWVCGYRLWFYSFIQWNLHCFSKYGILLNMLFG